MVVIDALHMSQGEGVAHGAEGASVQAGDVVVVGGLVAEVVGFGRVEPQGVDTLAHEALIEVVPELGAGGGVIDVVGACGHVGGIALDGDEASGIAEITVLGGGGAEIGPNGDHQLGVHGMHLVNHALIVGIVGVEEVHGVPMVVVAPILPVLHHAVERHTEAAIAAYDINDFLHAHVALFALIEAEVPQRGQLGLARERAPGAQHAVGVGAHEHIVVDGLSGGKERGAGGIVIKSGG